MGSSSSDDDSSSSSSDDSSSEEEEKDKKKKKKEKKDEKKEEPKKKEEDKMEVEQPAVPVVNGNGKKSKKENIPFKRIKEDEIDVDPKLSDNSFFSKEDEWGARANSVLSTVRGKGFRHEKTKKKRGSYKG